MAISAIAVGEIVGGDLAMDVAGASTFAEIAGGITMVGGAATLIGKVTGNQALTRTGSYIGEAGSLALGVGAVTGTLTTASSAAALPTGVQGVADAGAASANAATPALSDISGYSNAADNPLTSQAVAGSGGAAAPGDASAIASSASPATTAASGSPADSALASTNGIGSQSGISTDNSSGLSYNSATGAATNSQTGAAGNTLTGSGYSPTGGVNAGDQGSLWSQFKSLPLKDQLTAIQVGSGVVGGVANYLAPPPLAKSQIARNDAETALLQQQQATIAQHNAQVAQMGGRGSFAPTVASPVAQAAQATSAAPAFSPYGVNTLPSSPMSVNNNPLASSGLVQSNMIGGANGPI